MSGSFRNGQTVYDKDGIAYEFHHEHEGLGFVRSLHVLYGIDHEYEVSSEKFDVISIHDLFEEPPVKVVSDIVVEMKEKVEESKKELDDLRKQRYEMEANIRTLNNDVTKFEKDHPLFKEMRALTNGDEIYALSSQLMGGMFENQYPPQEYELENGMHLLSLLYVKEGKFRWTGKQSCNRSGDEDIRFFFSEHERNEHIKEGFDKNVRDFMKLDNMNEKFASQYSSRITYGKLERWVSTWDFLEMPVEVEQLKKKFENKVKEDQRRKLEKQLQELSNVVT